MVSEAHDRLVLGQKQPQSNAMDVGFTYVRAEDPCSTTASGHVNWREKGDLPYEELHFTMDKFHTFTHRLAEAVGKTMTVGILSFDDKSKTYEIPAVP